MSVKNILELFHRYNIQETDDKYLNLLIDVCLQKYKLTAERFEFILTDLTNREELRQIDIADVLEAMISQNEDYFIFLMFPPIYFK